MSSGWLVGWLGGGGGIPSNGCVPPIVCQAGQGCRLWAVDLRNINGHPLFMFHCVSWVSLAGVKDTKMQYARTHGRL